jgi:hypothetical protein
MLSDDSIKIKLYIESLIFRDDIFETPHRSRVSGQLLLGFPIRFHRVRESQFQISKISLDCRSIVKILRQFNSGRPQGTYRWGYYIYVNYFLQFFILKNIQS